MAAIPRALIWFSLLFLFSFFCKGIPADTLKMKGFKGMSTSQHVPFLQKFYGENEKKEFKVPPVLQPLREDDKYASYTYWYKFPVKNNQDIDDTLYIENKWFFEAFCFVLSTENELFFSDSLGLWVNPYNRYFPNEPYIGVIPIPAHTTVEVYVKSTFRNEESSWKLHDKASIYQYIYYQKQRLGVQTLINTLSLGFLGFVFLFFLLFAVSAKQKLHTSYCFYLFFALVYCFSQWNELPNHAQALMYKLSMLRYFLNETAVAWMFACYIVFTDLLLGISRQKKWFGKLLKIEAVILFVYGLHHLVFKLAGWDESEILNYSSFYFRIIFMPNHIIILAYIAFAIRSKLKSFFLLANLFLLAGVVASISVDFGLGVLHAYGNDIHPGALLQMGIVGETILFSLALGYNHIIITQQRDQHKKQYIEQLQENNKIIENERKVLAQKVEEARKEILEQQAQIEARKMAQVKTEFENKIQDLTIQSLEAQMNPHFLFNGLSAVRDLVLKNRNDEAMQYMNTFALLLRTSLNHNRKQSISLQEELESTSHYLQIEKLRFGTEFSFDIKISPEVDTEDVDVPPKLLQPIAENAVKHGLRHSSKNIKKISIKATKEKGDIWIHLEDNGIGLAASQVLNEKYPLERTHLGLKLIEERLVVFNQQHDHMISLKIEEITNNQGIVEGTRVAIRITQAV